MERSSRTSSRNQAPVRRLLATAVLGGLVLTGCAPEDVAGQAARAPITTVQEAPKLSTPTAVAPMPRSSEAQPPVQAAQSPEVAKAINNGLETIVRRMQNIDGYEVGNSEDGNRWIDAVVVAPAGPQLAPLVEPGHASAYRLHVDSSAPDTIIAKSANITAVYNTNPDGSHSKDEHVAFAFNASLGPDGAWNLAAHTDGDYAWATEGQEAINNRDALLAMAAQVASNAVEVKPIIPYNE